MSQTKLLRLYFMNVRNKLRVFVPDKPFQHSLMFVGKARAYPIEEAFRYSATGLAHKQDWAGKACQGQTL